MKITERDVSVFAKKQGPILVKRILMDFLISLEGKKEEEVIVDDVKIENPRVGKLEQYIEDLKNDGKGK